MLNTEEILKMKLLLLCLNLKQTQIISYPIKKIFVEKILFKLFLNSKHLRIIMQST